MPRQGPRVPRSDNHTDLADVRDGRQSYNSGGVHGALELLVRQHELFQDRQEPIDHTKSTSDRMSTMNSIACPPCHRL